MNMFTVLSSFPRQLMLGISLSVAIFSTDVSQAQLAASGTPGDRAVYSLDAGKFGTITDTTALPSATHTWDFDNSNSIVLGDTADSFDLGVDASADETKLFLTAGHHLVLYGGEWTGGGERSNPDTYIKLNGSEIPYGQSSGYGRDAANAESFTRGGTIVSVAQNDYIEIESRRTDIFAVDEPRDITQVSGDLQVVMLDGANLDFLRLSRTSTTALIPSGNTGTSIAVPYDSQDEIDATSFGHSTATDPEQITLKSAGHYLVLANTGLHVLTKGASRRNCLSQRIKLDGTSVVGGETVVYLRNSGAADTAGGLCDEGSVSVGVLVEATAANSILTVEMQRDSSADNSVVSVDHTRTGLAIVKLPSYGEYISLGESGASNNADINTATAESRSFASQTNVSNPSFTYASATSASQVVVNKAEDFLFLGSHQVEDYDTPGGGIRTTIRQGFQQTPSGGSAAALTYGTGGAYNRDQGAGNQASRDSGNWAAAVLSLGVGDAIETTTQRLGNTPVVAPSKLSLQGINITSISALPAVPIVGVNNPVLMSIGDPAVTIDGTFLSTTDGNDGPAALTYTLDSQPSGGDLKLSGATLNNGDTFTQDDVNNNLVTFEEGGVETDPGGFNFTVRDPGLDSESGTFVIRVIQAITVAADSATTDEDTAASEAQLTAGSNLLSNDSGNSITVTAFDALSTNGAAVSVNPDGTFTYDPLASGPLQQLSGGASVVDTFTYTVTDIIGKTDTATVSITVAGVNDAPEALHDVLNDGPLESASSYISTVDLTANDGSYRIGTPITFASSDLRLLPGNVATQTPSVGTPPGNGFPENALDGNVATFTHTQANNNTVDHIWQVDLGQDVSLENVTLFNRTSNQVRLRDITVTVLDGVGTEIFNSGLLNPTTVPITTVPSIFVDFAGPITGRTLVVTRTPDLTDANSGNGSILSLGEVTIIGSVAGVSVEVDDLLLNYEASQSAGTGRWENLGSNGGTNADWVLTDVTLAPVPGSARPQISAAYEWDNIADRAVFPTGPGTGNNISIASQLTGGVDLQDATWEFWLKPANTTQLMTIYENGGGTGFGCVIDNGVLEAASEFDGISQNGSYVSYNLLTDPLGLVGGDPTTDFNQYAVAITVNGGLALYVNGVKVDETSGGVTGDWDGGDGAGLGRFAGANHGGYQNSAAGLTYDAPFLGQMAIVRLYSGALSGSKILQNFQAVNTGTDIDGDAISAIGVLDGTGAFVANGSPATVASGAIVTMTNATGGFDYNPNGVFSLLPGETATDTFAYRVTDGNGGISQANVIVTITGVASPFDDNVLAKESEIKTYTPNELVKNDEINATPGAYVSLVPASLSGGTWTNQGTAGSSRNGPVTGSVVVAPNLTSGFQIIGSASTATNLLDLDAISTADATIEIWFRPTAGQTGKKTVYDTGGNGIGFSIVYDPATNEVIATVDGNDNVTDSIVATAGGISTTEFNQVIVLIDLNGGAEVGVGTGIFEDLISIVVNNDPTSPFDPTVDATALNAAGTANDWSGTDDGGLNRVQGTTALDENFPAAAGEVAIFRVYTRLLNATEQEANFDASILPIAGVSATTTGGRTVTLNGDGTVTVDFSGVSLPVGGSLVDDFTYNIAGGTATVNVLIEANTVQEDWRLDYYGDIANSGPGADSAPGANGLLNLQSFAWGLDPLVATGTLDVDAGTNTILSLGPPTAWVDPATNRIFMRHTRRADFAAVSLAINPQFSSQELTAFENNDDVGNPPTVIATGTGAGGVAIEAVQTEFPLILPTDGRKGRYGRVNVSN